MAIDVNQTGEFTDVNNRVWQLSTLPSQNQLRIGLKGESLDKQMLIDRDRVTELRNTLTQWLADESLVIVLTPPL